MVKNHIARLTAPTTWAIQRKASPRWVTKPSPGTHKTELSLPLCLIIKEFLNYSKTTREARKIINGKEVLLNNSSVTDYRFPVGLFDIVTFPKLKKSYTLLLNEKGKLFLKDIPTTTLKLCRIIGKTLLKGKKIQLNLSDSRNILIKKDTYKVGDSVIIELKDNSIKKHLKLDKGAIIYLIKGSHIGSVGKLEVIDEAKGVENSKIKFKNKEGKSVETLKDYAIVVEKESII